MAVAAAAGMDNPVNTAASFANGLRLQLIFSPGVSGARSIVGRRLPVFDGAQIRRRARKVVRDVRQRGAAIDRYTAGFQPEVEILRVIQLLHRFNITPI